ncbi:hypothetical protein TSAR_003206 [Trichomalopsis sarcophagae]|uniref:Uncharacterized protein n=1 Tax=Trichomalopsis sarcophagae TaxID=543379 RepID=A0A232EWL0_9HYME|nr:hypothetical protein TSAR_003206 [Trichomalopsis sarcophagae]
MRGSLSTWTGSQSEASKKRGPDEHERRASTRTSGEIREFSPDCRRLEEIGRVSQECASVTGAARWH